MKNIPQLLALAILFPALSQAAPARPETEQPSIVFILADDPGCVDVNAFAQRLTGAKPAAMFYETPNLDRLSKQGVSFSQAYWRQ